MREVSTSWRAVCHQSTPQAWSRTRVSPSPLCFAGGSASASAAAAAATGVARSREAVSPRPETAQDSGAARAKVEDGANDAPRPASLLDREAHPTGWLRRDDAGTQRAATGSWAPTRSVVDVIAREKQFRSLKLASLFVGSGIKGHPTSVSQRLVAVRSG